jgi:hypothetical protein
MRPTNVDPRHRWLVLAGVVALLALHAALGLRAVAARPR